MLFRLNLDDLKCLTSSFPLTFLKRSSTTEYKVIGLFFSNNWLTKGLQLHHKATHPVGVPLFSCITSLSRSGYQLFRTHSLVTSPPRHANSWSDQLIHCRNSCVEREKSVNYLADSLRCTVLRFPNARYFQGWEFKADIKLLLCGVSTIKEQLPSFKTCLIRWLVRSPINKQKTYVVSLCHRVKETASLLFLLSSYSMVVSSDELISRFAGYLLGGHKMNVDIVYAHVLHTRAPRS